jgi:hypothetical protein
MGRATAAIPNMIGKVTKANILIDRFMARRKRCLSFWMLENEEKST